MGDSRVPPTRLSETWLKRIAEGLLSEDAFQRELLESLREVLVLGQDSSAILIGRLFEDGRAAVRLHICRLLAQSNSMEATRLLAFAGLGDRDAAVAEEAAGELPKRGETGLWLTIRQLRSDHALVRIRAARVLREIGDPVATNYLVAVVDRPALLESHSRRLGDRVIEEEDEAIAGALAVCARERVGRLLAAFVFGSARSRTRILTALARTQDNRALEAVTRWRQHHGGALTGVGIEPPGGTEAYRDGSGEVLAVEHTTLEHTKEPVPLATQRLLKLSMLLAHDGGYLRPSSEVVNQQFEGLDRGELVEALQCFIEMQGRPGLPLVRLFLNDRNTPNTAICALCEVLGLASDAESRADFVRLLDSPDEAVRAAAFNAMIQLGDLASPQLLQARGTSASIKIVGEYLSAIVSGQEPPRLPDLAARPFVKPNPAYDLEIEENRMSLLEHVEVLKHCLCIIFYGMTIAGIAGAMVGLRAAPEALALLYGARTSNALSCLPNSTSPQWWFPVMLAAWIGTPLVMWQTWRFASVGLGSSERPLAARPALVLMLIPLSAPLLAIGVSRGLGISFNQFGFDLRDDPLRLAAYTNRITSILTVLITFVLGFTQVWRWLGLQQRMMGIVDLVAGRERREARNKGNWRQRFAEEYKRMENIMSGADQSQGALEDDQEPAAIDPSKARRRLVRVGVICIAVASLVSIYSLARAFVGIMLLLTAPFGIARAVSFIRSLRSTREEEA